MKSSGIASRAVQITTAGDARYQKSRNMLTLFFQFNTPFRSFGARRGKSREKSALLRIALCRLYGIGDYLLHAVFNMLLQIAVLCLYAFLCQIVYLPG